jgi:hypothetical protein
MPVRRACVVAAVTAFVIGTVSRAFADDGPTPLPDLPEPENVEPDAGVDAEPVEAAAVPDATPPRVPVVATIAVGAAYERAIDVPLYGFDAVGTFGGRVVSFEATGFYGRTEYGLIAWRMTGGMALDARVGETTRFGGSIYLGRIEVSRYTRPDTFVGGELGASLHLDVDVARFDASSLFVQIRGFGEIGGLPIFGGTAHFGIRYGP